VLGIWRVRGGLRKISTVFLKERSAVQSCMYFGRTFL
jgi:hypothetical protein